MSGEVLADTEIRQLIKDGHIIGADPALVNPSSLDVRIGKKFWKLNGVSPQDIGQRVQELLDGTGIVDKTSTASRDFYIESGQQYLFKLRESLKLPKNISAKMFNKSGRARIFMSTKGMSDGMPQFNLISRGYAGPVYAKIASAAFPLVVDAGNMAIPQMRFYRGVPVPLTGDRLEGVLRSEKYGPVLLDRNNEPIAFSQHEYNRILRTGMIPFTADLSRDVLVYRAKRDKKTVDLRKKGHEPFDFFEAVRPEPSIKRGYTIHPGECVLVHPREKIRIHPQLAAEVVEYAPDLGAMKVSFADLINAGHGYEEGKVSGDHIVFEMMAVEPMYLWNGRRIAYFQLFEMSQRPEQQYKPKESKGFDSLASILPAPFFPLDK
jgi:dCTP deaminase